MIAATRMHTGQLLGRRVLFESRNVQRNLIPRGRLGPLPSVSKGTA